MNFSIVGRPANGIVDRAIDANLVAGGDFSTKQIELQIGVRDPNLGRIVAPTVVALGEDIYMVYVTRAKCILPLLFVKPFANSGDEFRSVKVQVHLPRARAWTAGQVVS